MESLNRQQELEAFESDAELLAAEQLDLLSQLEQQLRAVRQTMLCIEKLRSGRLRVGPELTDGQRETTLRTLASEMAVLDQQIDFEHGCCSEMQDTVRRMRERVTNLRRGSRRCRTY